MSLSGTLPGLNPGIFTLRASFLRRVSTSRSISAAGTDIDTRRSSVPSVSTLAIPLLIRRCDLYLMVRREGLEPTRLAAPAPKAGASTSSATLAARTTKKARKKQRIIPFGPMPVGHYENFPVASLLLPRRLRPPVEIIYRFARSADDIADEGTAADDVRLSRLSVYRSELARIAVGEIPDAPLFGDVARIVREYGLPIGLFDDLIDAFAQ